MCIEWECEHEKFNGIKIVTSKKLRVKWTQRTHTYTERQRLKDQLTVKGKTTISDFLCAVFFFDCSNK